MNKKKTAVVYAIFAAVLYAINVPFSKLLLDYASPTMMAAFLYLGAGSVVTKDIPSNVVAVGNPCRVIREIGEHNMEYYFRDRKLEEEV